jgi:uncharacterized protein (TIGR00369 family)
MTLWTRTFALEELNAVGRRTASEHCGVHFTGIGDDWIEGTIPLDARTRNMDGSLHPGALGILAETIGSVAATLCIDTSKQICVGQILHINHPAPVTAGPIRARASAIAVLADSHVWDVEMRDPTDTVVGVARLTMAVLDRREQ